MSYTTFCTCLYWQLNYLLLRWSMHHHGTALPLELCLHCQKSLHCQKITTHSMLVFPFFWISLVIEGTLFCSFTRLCGVRENAQTLYTPLSFSNAFGRKTGSRRMWLLPVLVRTAHCLGTTCCLSLPKQSVLNILKNQSLSEGQDPWDSLDQ